MDVGPEQVAHVRFVTSVDPTSIPPERATLLGIGDNGGRGWNATGRNAGPVGSVF